MDFAGADADVGGTGLFVPAALGFVAAFDPFVLYGAPASALDVVCNRADVGRRRALGFATPEVAAALDFAGKWATATGGPEWVGGG
jgi:hypothetical protein